MAAQTGPDTTESPPESAPARERMWRVLAGLLAAVVVLYSLLIVQQPLVGVLTAVLLVGLTYGVQFVRRFARAYRRRTEAMEEMADSLARLAEERTDSGATDGSGVER